MRHEYEIVEHPHLEYLNLFLVKLIHRRLHLHREFEICMVLEGEVTVYTTGKTAVLKKEDVILLNPRQVHAFHSMTENALLLSIQVMPGAFEKICQGIRYTEFDTLCLSEPEYQGETLDHLRELFYRLGIAYYEKQPNYEFFCMAYIYEIFGQIFRIYPWHILTERQKMNVYQQGKRMERILEYVDRNYTDKLLLTEIAEQEKLSVAYLSHFFKDTMGMTFQQYVNFLRFEKARKMIENTTVSISEISILCGFSDYRYLNKIYKEQLGYLPSEYRSTHCAPKIREDSEDLENDQTFVLSGKALEFLKKAAEKNQKKEVIVMKKKVIAAGHICIDITPVFPDEKVEKLGDILSPGKLLNVGSADVHTGGSVANTGMCMHKLGADVSLMGKIGNDEFGNMVLGILKEYGLDSGMIVSDTSTTSYSVVLAVPGIDRIFLHHPGANHDFHCSDIRKDLLKEAVLFHFGYPPLMESMYREEGKELTEMFRMVAGEGVVTSLDMAAVDEKTEAGKADWEKILRNTLPFVDLFFPSIEELLYMLDRKRYTELQKKAGGGDIIDVLSIENDVKPLAEKLIDMGVGIAVIKCGVKGMYYKTGNADAMARLREKSGRKLEGFENQEGLEKSYVPARVRSATGAGDTSIGAFLCAVLSDRPLLQCMHLAAGTGASCVEEYDALSGLRSFEELEKKIAEGWQKQQ